MEQENNTKTFDEQFDELVAKRKRLDESHKENESDLFNLLARFYPDKAHFIYELLQNAEDMEATQVKFLLDSNKLIFKHNGNKRDFGINDIKAITNIGNSLVKLNDPNAIGKFGIGFKSVFVYTDSPEIHWGDLHFKIENYVVPNRNNIEKISTLDKDNVKWTVFIFPFNKSTKTPQKAFEEISNGLNELNYESILFLRNIKVINYSIGGYEKISIKLLEEEQNIVKIVKQKKYKEKIELVESIMWLRFVECVRHQNEEGYYKNLPIGIAYKIQQIDNTKFKIKETEGKAFIYFPAINVYTGLRFLINAPFSSTPARDSIINCDENLGLVKKLSSLIIKSLDHIKKMGLMNIDFFDVLPNKDDKIKDMFKNILPEIIKTFRYNDYIPSTEGEYICSSDGLLSEKKAYIDVINQKILKSVMNKDKIWVQNTLKNSNAYKFLHSLEMEEFNTDYFLDLLSETKYITFDKYLINYIANENRENIINWFKNFYYLCENEYKNLTNNGKNLIIQFFNKKTILSEDYKLCTRLNIFFLNNSYFSNKNVDFVNRFIANEKDKNEIPKIIYKFFKNELDIKLLDKKEEIKLRLLKYLSDTSFNIDDDYIRDLLEFWSFHNLTNFDFSEEKIFLYKKSNGLYQNIKAKDLVLVKEYGNYNGNLLAKIYGKQQIYNNYIDKIVEYLNNHKKEEFIDTFYNTLNRNSNNADIIRQIKVYLKDSQEDKDKLIIKWLFTDFLKSNGILFQIRIIQSDITDHPLFKKFPNSCSKMTSSAINIDYNILYLEKFLKYDGFSKLLFDYLKEQKLKEFAIAKYTPNKTSRLHQCESTLFFKLNNLKWLPDKNNQLHTPSEIFVTELRDDFEYDKNSPLLESLKFKTNRIITVKSIDNELMDKLKEKNLKAISVQLFDELMLLKREKEDKEEKARLRRREKEQKAIDEILENESKERIYNENEDNEIYNDGSVKNIGRREEKITETFNDLKDIKPELRECFTIVTKTTNEERIQLQQWYRGKCQICGWDKKAANGKPLFEGINIIKSSNLPEKVRNTEILCWNSLCLCPNHAIAYKNCSKNIKGIIEEIEGITINEGVDSKIPIKIIIDNRLCQINFVPKHLLALKTVLNLLKNNK